ncbi:MAG: serine/threonine-protein phosphatase [Acidobacteria bacterium]|nr:serine/threonine-protein phosphatase [Acidobacteriota bacterium]
MIRCLLLALLSIPLAGQPGLYIDLKQGWRGSAGAGPEIFRPDYDDSQWTPVDFTQPQRRQRRLRRTVDLPDDANRAQLALTLGCFAFTYEVFVNGRRIAKVGDFDDASLTQLMRTRTFPIPADAFVPGKTQTIVLSLGGGARASLFWRSAGPGLYLLTDRTLAPVGEGARDLQLSRSQHTPTLILCVIGLMLCIPLLLAWIGERDRTELLWLCGYLAATSAYGLQAILLIAPDARPFTRDGFIWLQILTRYGALAMSTSFVVAALGFRLPWVHAAIWLAWLWLQLPFRLSQHFGYFTFATAGLSLALVAASWTRAATARAPLGRHVFLLALSLSAVEQIASRIYPGAAGSGEYLLQFGSYFCSSRHLMVLGVAAVMVTFLLQQTAAQRREQQRLAGEMESARNAQRFLLGGGGTVRMGGCELDTVYEPAFEVGGDFHWTREEPDGALTVVVGDVSGKGLKAAMLVSVAIGILENERSSSPAAILASLNAGVLRHAAGGFVTCCCVRIVAHTVTVANAGHLAPYCQGAELNVEAGLPLGIVPDSTWAESSFRLAPGGQLTIVSDGVVEAENAQRELFGFDRTREISMKSAREIAAAAKAWGQNDDITVVTIRRPG